MIIALISDIHANLEALTAVLKDIESRQVDAVYCLGDVVGYGAQPAECLELVNKTCKVKLIGNHEYAAMGLVSTEKYNVAARTANDWTKSQLTDREIAIMADFDIDHLEDPCYFVHSSPWQPDQWHYIVSPVDAQMAFEHMSTRLCFFGHSHVPLIAVENGDELPRCKVGHSFLPDPEGRYLINVGSVGQPRDSDPRACYVVVDVGESEVDFCRVEYDIKQAQQGMLHAQLPEPLISRLEVGR
ncbi:MAG: metallophosphoesterase family protein [Candidatus Zixiibacteriota bacterium]